MQFLVHQIARKIMLLPVNNLHEKISQKSETDEILKACALLVNCARVTTLHLCYNFALVLHENALVFSQSKAWNFFHVHY